MAFNRDLRQCYMNFAITPKKYSFGVIVKKSKKYSQITPVHYSNRYRYKIGKLSPLVRPSIF